MSIGRTPRTRSAFFRRQAAPTPDGLGGDGLSTLRSADSDAQGPGTLEALAPYIALTHSPGAVNSPALSLVANDAGAGRLRITHGECGAPCDELPPTLPGTRQHRVLFRRASDFLGGALNDTRGVSAQT